MNQIESLKSQLKELDEKNIKLLARDSQRKTIHEWLNDAGIPREESGKPICLLRRIRILLDIYTNLKKFYAPIQELLEKEDPDEYSEKDLKVRFEEKE